MVKINKRALNEYEKLALELGTIVYNKNSAYGDAVTKTAEILKILYPNGIKPEQYCDSLTVTRIVDKLCRIATDNDPFGEDPYEDINGYSLIRALQNRKEKEKKK